RPEITSSHEIKQSIADAGHDTDETRATQEVYEELHQCCLYERLGEEEQANHQHDDHDDHHAHDHDHIIRGVVVKENNRGDLTPITGVNVHWLENKATLQQSNDEGVFDIKHEKGYRHLVVSYAGMQPDTIEVKNLHEILVIHAKDNVLGEVVVSRRQRTAYVDKLNANRVETITARELFKAAC